jgi:beta-glucosidase
MTAAADTLSDTDARRVNSLLERMSLEEKIGQMWQAQAGHGNPAEYLGEALRAGEVGSVINCVDLDVVNELQRIAVEESRLGIPLLVARDVIHGFRTVMPIPLGLAATWNTGLVTAAARVAAQEAAAQGVNWALAPMIDITRDPRWGRIAESPGEDPFLAGAMAAAQVRGFQGDDLAAPGSVAACAKHFAGYGEVEAGRDYAATNVAENELRNVHLRPFKAACDAGLATVMASFSDVDGVPATANHFLLTQILRDEWGFDGVVVSDWDSVRQLAIHGLTENDAQSAHEAAVAGVDMEMAGDAFRKHLADLVRAGKIDVGAIDAAAGRILLCKLRLGLFEQPYVDRATLPVPNSDDARQTALQAAIESTVLLKNEHAVLPFDRANMRSIAVVGPLADAPYEQLGTWIFDADTTGGVSLLDGIREQAGAGVSIEHVAALATSRSRDTSNFAAAIQAARQADAVVLCLGEESLLSGEAHCRAEIGLPGAQTELVRRIRSCGKPVIGVILAGRPLVLADVVDDLDAVLYGWHPGTMGGPAIAELLFGNVSPCGKLPVSFPRAVGQVPIYYNHKNTGRPPEPGKVAHIDDIPVAAPQTSFGMTSYHLDAGFEPLWEFGFGLSYTAFEFTDIAVNTDELRVGEAVSISAKVCNVGARTATEVVQLYVRDLVGSVTRPVRELKGFQRVNLYPGESRTVEFELHSDELGFFGRDNRPVVEPGEFHVWIGGSSAASLRSEFRIVAAAADGDR